MFARVAIGVSDLAASERFYATVLATLGIEPADAGTWREFALVAARDRAVTRGLHIGFVAPSREHVDAFWRAGTAAGHPDDGRPGPRPQYREDYYGAFLLDPDGNSAEAVHHGALRQGGAVDHLWLRTPDLPASRRFFAALGAHADVHLAGDAPDHVHLAASRGGGSFSLVPGEATRHVALEFPSAGGGPSPFDDEVADAHGNTVRVVRAPG